MGSEIASYTAVKGRAGCVVVAGPDAIDRMPNNMSKIAVILLFRLRERWKYTVGISMYSIYSTDL
jgi:hypothetical protein